MQGVFKVKKDAERRVAEAEAMGQEDTVADEDIAQSQEPESSEPVNDWCCMYRVLSLQSDFATEKPILQHYVESQGHVYMFLLKFHCELNPIEMLWVMQNIVNSCSNFILNSLNIYNRLS
jgi:hypothetical protein